MKKKPSSRRKRSKSVLRLPDLEHAKAAVLNSLNSTDAKRGYRHAIDEFVDWYYSKAPGLSGYAPRGIDIDRNGLIWTALSGSGQLASFDRRKCKVLNGLTATGQQCPEGWTLYTAPGPKMKGVSDESSADFEYYNWVDQFNALGLGENIPIVTGTSSDSLQAFNPTTKKWTILRKPYPMGFFSRGMDGRIDSPNAGWKGRGIWATYGGDMTWHIEGGAGTKNKLVKFQLRPSPLAD